MRHDVIVDGVRGDSTLERLAALEEAGGRHDVVATCESGGMANATLIERCEEQA